MKQALTFVKNEGSIGQAGRKFNTPESSIRKRRNAFVTGLDIIASLIVFFHLPKKTNYDNIFLSWLNSMIS